MSSLLDAPPVIGLLGSQEPRICSLPPLEPGDDASEGDEAIELAALAGLHLDPWQQLVLRRALRKRRSGKWAAFEVALIVSRQNGKGAILEALELAALFLHEGQGNDLILHSAHEFKTASEAFRRISRLVQDRPEFDRRVRQIRTGAGTESIELKSGRRLRFVARSSGSGRGFSGDLVILDEAYNLGDEAMGALLPTLSARPNPQVWYTSTAGNELSVQLGRVRERGLRGDDPSLAFFEWSVDEERYDPADPAAVALANPGLGIRIAAEYVDKERRALGPEMFDRERLGVGRYPTDLTDVWAVIPERVWDGLADNDSEVEDPVALAVDVQPDARGSSIALAGRRSDGMLFVELLKRDRGTAWVKDFLIQRDREWDPCAIVIDVGGPAGSLADELELAGLPIRRPKVSEIAHACGQLFDDVMDSGTLRHLGDVESQRPLRQALAGAQKRPLRDAWAWDRKHPSVDISPLVAVTLAAWGYRTYGQELGPDDVLVRAI